MQIVSPRPNEPRPARIEPLACLPVFLSLTDERVVVIGGGDAACWKAELLAAAGARVEVYAPEMSRSAELLDLARQGGSAGSVTLIDGAWRPEHLIGAALAVADIEDGAEAAQFAAAATAAGVPFNVIDKPQFCQFQFGGIVNRSPVVVGISTVGAAPILGQAVRRRIEMLLPKTLAHWGQLAREIRAAVMSRLSPGPQRRAFWEKVSDLAFETAPTDRFDPLELIEDIANGKPASGRVTLIGAGPGDADLLTIRAVRAMQSADIILFDDDIAAEMLDFARREARRLPVGQHAGRQGEIVDMLVMLAGQGKHVVRLKSREPAAFGRNDDDVAALQRAGIAVETVPGVATARMPAERRRAAAGAAPFRPLMARQDLEIAG